MNMNMNIEVAMDQNMNMPKSLSRTWLTDTEFPQEPMDSDDSSSVYIPSLIIRPHLHYFAEVSRKGYYEQLRE